VLVTDREGRPVPGLTREDFQVLEDGKPAEVTNVSSSTERPVMLAVFLDETSLGGSARATALAGLRRFFASSLRPGDRALLVQWDGALKIHGDPTGDAAALGATLDRLGTRAAGGRSSAQERVAIQREIEQARLPDDDEITRAIFRAQANSIQGSLRIYVQSRSSEVRAEVEALQQTLALLSSLPERKALLYVGGGLPMRPAADLLTAWRTKFSSLGAELASSSLELDFGDNSRLVQQTVDRANAAGIALHALSFPEKGAASAAQSGATEWDPEDAARALRNLAAGTGGRAVTDVQNPAGFLARTGSDVAGSYLLGYTPLTGGRTGRHRIKVTVRGGALAARHREERLDGDAADPLLRRALAALWTGGLSGPGGEANPLKAELSVEQEEREEDGRFRVTAVVALPLAAVFVQPQENFHVAHLTVAVAARDGKGRISGLPRGEFPIEIPNERLLSASGQSAGYRFVLRLAPGDSLLAVALRDDVSGTQSVVRLALTPGASKP
jgi:VWFA-related protein